MQELRKENDPNFPAIDLAIWKPGSYTIAPWDNLEEKFTLLVQEAEEQPDTTAAKIIEIKPEIPSTGWKKPITVKLISIVGDYQDELNDPKKKKIVTWGTIAQKMTEGSFQPTYLQCETRWKYLVKKYKEFIANKNQSGAARKEFEYSEEMATVLDKRPDIFPPLLVGTNVGKKGEKRPSETAISQNETKTTKRARPAQSPAQGMFSKCMDMMSDMSKQQLENDKTRLENDKRRLDILEKIASSLSK